MLWRDPAHAVSGLLHVISASLGGDLVVWTSVDDATGLVTVVDLADPLAPAQVLSDLLQRSGALASELAERSRGRVRSAAAGPGRSPPADFSAEAFPEPWPEYFATHPIHGLIAVPIELDDGATGVLIAARRTDVEPYTADDLQLVEAGAHRLVGQPTSARRRRQRRVARGRGAVDGHGSGDRSACRSCCSVRACRCSRRRTVAAATTTPSTGPVSCSCSDASSRPSSPACGLPPLSACWARSRCGGRSRHRRGRGALPAGATWSASSCSSPRSVGVILLEFRLEEVRESERLERQLSETLLDQSPVAMAVFDHQLRYQRVNQPMADMNGFTAGRARRAAAGRSQPDGRPVVRASAATGARQRAADHRSRADDPDAGDRVGAALEGELPAAARRRCGGRRHRRSRDRRDPRHRLAAASRTTAAAVRVTDHRHRRAADRRLRLLVPDRHVPGSGDGRAARQRRARRRCARRVRRARCVRLARPAGHAARGRADRRGGAHQHTCGAAGPARTSSGGIPGWSQRRRSRRTTRPACRCRCAPTQRASPSA